MKILNFGSLNIDNVYTVEEFVRPGETVTAQSRTVFAGGKGLNQSLAAARAGADVIHAGAVGSDGGSLIDLLEQSGVDVSHLLETDTPTGHTVIEVDAEGENRILVWGGANRELTHSYLEKIFSYGEEGDIVLLQNETNLIETIIRRAHGLGFRVVFNPSPFPAGELGSIALLSGTQYAQEAFPVTVIDTTGAGDTFCGYFLAAACARRSPQMALSEASAAAALAVSRAGAAPSIPQVDEVRTFLKKRMFLQQIE